MSIGSSKHKIVVLGDINVGKTALVTHCLYQNFYTSYTPTVGIDFMSKTIHVDNAALLLKIWDTAGQERFRSLVPGYIRDSSVAIIVYDITDKSTFDSLEFWISLVRNLKDMPILIAGNKADLEEDRKINYSEGKKFAEENNALFFETSAKNGQDILKMFMEIGGILVKNYSVNEPENDSSILELKPLSTNSSNQCKCRC
uniref:Ras-related protein RABH1d (Trinotate prediction) n=1 Tax=Henneguya salminicola TaxID=69463 RepID=A0A6B2G4C4_HENSL